MSTSSLKLWRIDDSSDGRTWVVAKDEANALLEFCRSDDDSFAEYRFCDLEATLVDPAQAITMDREECDGGPEIKTAAEWCAEHGKGVLCSSWWTL
jgi:hypothetical protein